MNWKKLLLAAFGLTAMGVLASCTGFETASSGEVIRNPSAEDMERLHEQWGMPRRQVKPRYRPAMPGDFMNQSSSSASSSAADTVPAPALQEPAPEPIPSPTPSPEVPAPPTTPAPPIPDTLR